MRSATRRSEPNALALADDHDPAGRDDEAFPVALEVDADLRARLHDDVLVDDRVADDCAVADVRAVQQIESSTTAPESTRTSGESTERRTVPPATITPAHTIESIAIPVWPGSSNTNFAGGKRSGWARIGQ